MSLEARNDSDWRRQFGAHSWEKADLDGNGTTDLLINGYVNSAGGSGITSCFVLLNFGRDSVRIIRLFNASLQFLVAKKFVVDGHTDIVTLHFAPIVGRRLGQDFSPHLSDTLTWRFGHFIERTRRSPTQPIREIRYCAWGFFGPDPGYGFTIYGDSIRYVRPPSVDEDFRFRDSGGIYLARLDSATAGELFGLINYLHIPSSQKQYAVPWTDAGMYTLKIDYQNGTAVRIDDGGGLGTFGLSALHQLLSGLIDSQHWTRIASVPPFTSPCP